MPTAAPPKPPPPAPPKPPAAKPPSVSSPQPRAFSASSGVTVRAHKVMIYGPGGIGKTELCANMKKIGIVPFFLDVDDGTPFLDVARIEPPLVSFDELRTVLNDDQLFDKYDAIVLDSLTRIEELAIEWVIANVKHDKGKPITCIDSYGWGKGFAHVFDAMLLLLSDLDRVIRTGKHVVCVCHECTETVPNPGGDDWIQYQPRLQSTKQGRIRERAKEWCDHLLRIEFDVHVVEGKAQGSGSRTIYPTQTPTHWAKSRTLSESIVYKQGDATLWTQLFNGGK